MLHLHLTFFLPNKAIIRASRQRKSSISLCLQRVSYSSKDVCVVGFRVAQYQCLCFFVYGSSESPRMGFLSVRFPGSSC